MTESAHVESMNRLQRQVGTDLRQIGFKMRGRTFNRVTDDGLTQVVGFQMGPSDPPGTTYVPGLRENLYGWFTVNLGVYVPEVGLYTGESGRFVQETYCCIRERLGVVGPEGRDTWWKICDDPDVVTELRERLAANGIPFLDRFRSRDDILLEWSTATENVGGGRPPRIVKAIILSARNQRDAARELLRQQAAETRLPGHAEYVRELAATLGLGSLPDTVS